MSPRVEPADGFLTDYYEHVSEDDVRYYTPETLLERARYHRTLAERREPGQAVIGVLNESDASVVAIVADDMPYLLPSVTAEIARDTASIRLLVHPTFSVERDPVTHRLTEVHRAPHRTALPTGVEPSNTGSPAGPATQQHHDGGLLTEAWMAIEIPRLPDEAADGAPCQAATGSPAGCSVRGRGHRSNPPGTCKPRQGIGRTCRIRPRSQGSPGAAGVAG